MYVSLISVSRCTKKFLFFTSILTLDVMHLPADGTTQRYSRDFIGISICSEILRSPVSS